LAAATKEQHMSMSRSISRSLPLVAGALVGIAPIAAAQWNNGNSRNNNNNGQELFEWRGGVDREVQIVMRGNRIWTNNVGRTEPNNERSRTFASLPRQDGEVVVRLENGRGDVDILQQPTSGNNYTTIVRIRDPRGGSDNYRLAAYWQNTSYGDVYRNGRGRGNNGNDDRDDEMRNRRRNDDWDRNGNNGVNGNNGRNESVMRWSGNVDDDLEIRLQNGRVEYRTLSGAQPTSIRVNSGNANIPRSNANLRVVQNSGRGQVYITQQPSQWNGYTTVLRVRDPQGGYGYYDFDLMWQ
jgi:hypothetical protein